MYFRNHRLYEVSKWFSNVLEKEKEIQQTSQQWLQTSQFCFKYLDIRPNPGQWGQGVATCVISTDNRDYVLHQAC